MAKRSFFERLTGAVNLDSDQETPDVLPEESISPDKASWHEESVDGELSVDVYETATHVVVKTMVAGVRPEDIDIHITRDMVVIKGKREDEKEIRHDDYFHKELYWGSFSRSIVLPQEVEPDEAEAVERHGLLIIKIPKIDKHRKTKVKVRSNN